MAEITGHFKIGPQDGTAIWHEGPERYVECLHESCRGYIKGMGLRAALRSAIEHHDEIANGGSKCTTIKPLRELVK